MNHVTDVDHKMPWQVRAVAFIGFPAVVAGFLLWVMVGMVQAQLSSIQESIRLHQIDAAYSIMTNEDQTRINQQQTVQLEAMHRLLQQICVNTARTPADRATCWSPWR